MINITDAAAKQINLSIQQNEDQNTVLRIAARRMPDGGIDHTMGFDESTQSDTLLTVNDVDVAISNDAKGLLQGLLLDYVEYQPGDFRFIFTNPNDTAPISEQ
jgi:iron-sulfur cluster assembly protein